MHNLLKVVTFTATLGSTHLFASDGVFLLTEAPDLPNQRLVYETNPNLRINEHGYVQDDNDRFLLGWNIQNGLLHDPLNWQISRNNLSLVKYLESMAPFHQTTFLQTSFTLPLTDLIGSTYQHQWDNVVDNMGNHHDFMATFTKNAAATWFVSLESADALSVVRNGPGGLSIDSLNPLVLNFDGSNYLLDVDGLPSTANLYIQWDPAQTPAYDSNIILDFGPLGMPTSTRIEDGVFGVSQSFQDGSAPSEPISAQVDATGTLRTIYEDGAEEDSFQLAYIALGETPSFTVERAPLDTSTQGTINSIFPVVTP